MTRICVVSAAASGSAILEDVLHRLMEREQGGCHVIGLDELNSLLYPSENAHETGPSVVIIVGGGSLDHHPAGSGTGSDASSLRSLMLSSPKDPARFSSFLSASSPEQAAWTSNIDGRD